MKVRGRKNTEFPEPTLALSGIDDAMMIPFNKPYKCGNELQYIQDAIKRGKISGNGHYTKLCQSFFEKKYGFLKCLLTTSCTDALEMAAILLEIEPGDEVIVPSYTFVSTANAFVLRGAKIVFADSGKNHPNINSDELESLISAKTKAIVVVHYAGMACDMGEIMSIANKFGVFVVEDAAQAIDGYYKNGDERRPLGGIGHLGAVSFHETKNIISGEGGMLIINDKQFVKRAEIIWEKGTNRASFFRGEIDKYGWVDIGSSFLMSELNAAYLYAQLEELKAIQSSRLAIYWAYNDYFNGVKGLERPECPRHSTLNGHMFYLLAKDLEHRSWVLKALNEGGIHAVFHYGPLHHGIVQRHNHDGRELINSERYADCLLRLPIFPELDFAAVEMRLNQVRFDEYN